jgi:hypothetical protein
VTLTHLVEFAVFSGGSVWGSGRYSAVASGTVQGPAQVCQLYTGTGTVSIQWSANWPGPNFNSPRSSANHNGTGPANFELFCNGYGPCNPFGGTTYATGHVVRAVYGYPFTAEFFISGPSSYNGQSYTGSSSPVGVIGASKLVVPPIPPCPIGVFGGTPDCPAGISASADGVEWNSPNPFNLGVPVVSSSQSVNRTYYANSFSRTGQASASGEYVLGNETISVAVG